MQATLIPAGACAWLASCAVEPPRARPDMLEVDVPAAWSAAAAPADGARAPSRVDWWREFGDPRLDELVMLGLANNPNLRASLARFEAAAAGRVIAGAPLLPAFDASLQSDRLQRQFLGFPFGGAGGLPPTTFTQFGLSLGVRWELDVWGRLRSADAAALADQQAAVNDLQGAQLSLAAQVCRAWYAAVEARQQAELAAATVAAFERTLEDVRDRYRRGVRPALEVHQAATNLANAQSNATQRTDLLQRALRQLDTLVGRYPGGDFPLSEDLPDVLPGVPAGIPSELLQRRPDLRAAERRVAAAGCRVEAANAALYPKLALSANAGTQSVDIDDILDQDSGAWALGANLLQPIFQGGALRAEVDRRRALRKEALARYTDAVLRAFREVEDILAADALLERRSRSLEDAVTNAAQARDLARERWQAGLTDFLAVADGQRQAFQAESAQLTLARQRIDNRIDLLLALGGGYQNASDDDANAR